MVQKQLFLDSAVDVPYVREIPITSKRALGFSNGKDHTITV